MKQRTGTLLITTAAAPPRARGPRALWSTSIGTSQGRPTWSTPATGPPASCPASATTSSCATAGPPLRTAR